MREYSAGPNALAVAKSEILARGERVVNLVSGKMPPFPQDALRAALDEAQPRAVAYSPDPLGRLEAREAITAFYERSGVRVSPEHVVVTPGTSVSYLYVFSVLAEAGDEILVPRPSYPLFDEIARIPGVRLVPYWLRESDGWRIDLEHLETQVSTRTRAVILISPHNPTGAVATHEEIAGLAEIARRHDLALIVDEVFSEFIFDGRTLTRPAAIGDAPLVLTLNGFSKMFSLPGWKVGWIAVSGDTERVAKATWMLAHVADAILPVNEWAQCAVPGIFARGAEFARLREHAGRGRRRAPGLGHPRSHVDCAARGRLLPDRAPRRRRAGRRGGVSGSLAPRPTVRSPGLLLRSAARSPRDVVHGRRDGAAPGARRASGSTDGALTLDPPATLHDAGSLRAESCSMHERSPSCRGRTCPRHLPATIGTASVCHGTERTDVLRRPGSEEATLVIDLVLVLVTILFFEAGWLYALACDRL